MINLKNKHILVVEDDDMSFIYIEQILKMTACEINRVKTGIDAIEAFRLHKETDLILLDVQLPDMDGEKTAIEIRKVDQGVPIIAQTASQVGSDRERLLKAGCADFVAKPYAIEEMLDLIAKYIR